MAASDSRAFPEKGVAQRVYGVFTLVTTGKESSGALTALAASVSKDGGAYASCTNSPVQQGTTGIVYVDLTTTEMNANQVIVKFTSSLANAVDVIVPITPLEWASASGRGNSRFEQLLRKVFEFCANLMTRSSSSMTVYCDDGTTASLTCTVTEGDTTGTRGAMS